MADKTDIPLGRFNVAGGEILAKKQAEFNVTAPSTGRPIIAGTSLTQGTQFLAAGFTNTEFIRNFNPTKVIQDVRPTKVVVVSQDPDPNIFLPAGTPVDLVMAIKEDLSVEIFNNIEAVVTEKYQSVGSVLEDLNKANDAKAEAAKKVLEEKSEVKYSELLPQDAKAVNDFIKDRFNINPDVATDKEKAAKVFDNLRFLNSF